MRILSFSLKLILLALIGTIVMPGCKDDNATPDKAKIRGTVTLENADLWSTWKDSGVVELTIFPAFTLNPPAGWGDIPVDFLYPGFPGGRFALGAPYNAQNPVVFNYVAGKTQFDYEIEVEPGTYSALAVGFRHNLITDPSKKSATLGVDWIQPDSVSHGLVIKYDAGGTIITVFNDPAPSTITVEKGDNVELNFKADFGFVLVWPFR